jgi:hypothetical protein
VTVAVGLETRLQPPSCNTGASELTWDWYEVTIKGSSDALTRANGVMSVLGSVVGPGSRWKAIRALHGYQAGQELLGVEVGALMVFYGAGDVHVRASGAIAEPVCDLLRKWWPDHIVSRADVAYDVVSAGSFERLYKRVHHLARNNPRAKVSTSTVGDWLDGELGRTFYAGGNSSRLRIRIYEKGHEQRAKDPLCDADLNWTRVEWQLRPTSDQKSWLGRASKVEALGLSAFGAAVAGDVLGSDVVAVGGLLRFASQDPGYWMARQYRRVLLDLLELDAEDIRDRIAQLVEQADPIRH